MTKIVCVLCMKPLPEHRAGCYLTNTPIFVEPHKFSPFKGDKLGRMCASIWCPYNASEHPVVDLVWLNPKDKVTQ